MIEKPKSKVEDIARRREWMGNLTIYLVLVLIGLIVIVLNHDDPIGTFVATLSLFPTISAACVVVLLWKQLNSGRINGDEVGCIMASSLCVGAVVAGLVSGLLLRLIDWAAD